MEGKCCKCERVTKYKCLACFTQNFREERSWQLQRGRKVNWKMLKLWWKSCSSHTKKRQQTLKGFFDKKKQTDEHSKTQ